MAKALDLVGQRFGRLTVIRNATEEEKPKDINGNPKPRTWCICKCDCGKELVVRGNNLKTGDNQSCGCTKSKGEELINKFLLDNYYTFKKEYSFNDLLSNNNNPLKFDFCILNDNNKPIKIIEVNGTQHYQKNHQWYSEERVEYDIKKREYCKQHNIPLLDLDYNKDDSIPEKIWMEKLTTFLGGNTN